MCVYGVGQCVVVESPGYEPAGQAQGKTLVCSVSSSYMLSFCDLYWASMYI